MVAYRRNFVPGGTFFFTVVLENRRSSLLVEKIASLRLAFRVTRSERPFKIDAIVILPDHLHAILTLPEGDSDFSGRWRQIKSVFTCRLHPLQPGQHGLVNRVSDWPHSSFHRYVRGGLLPEDRAGTVETENAAFGERME